MNEPGLDGFTDIPDSRLEEDLDQTNSHAMSLSPGSATSPEDRSSPRVFAPPAHSTPVIPEKYKPPPSVAMKIKDENGGDTPLDFSVRKYDQVSHHLSQAHLNGGKMVITLGPEELPMDLSVQRSPDASPKFKEAGHMKVFISLMCYAIALGIKSTQALSSVTLILGVNMNENKTNRSTYRKVSIASYCIFYTC